MKTCILVMSLTYGQCALCDRQLWLEDMRMEMAYKAMVNCHPSRHQLIVTNPYPTDLLTIQHYQKQFLTNTFLIPEGIKSTNPFIQSGAILAAVIKKMPLTNEVLPLLTSDNQYVQQSARLLLVRTLSTPYRPVDFGPLMGVTSDAARESQKLWRKLLEKQSSYQK